MLVETALGESNGTIRQVDASRALRSSGSGTALYAGAIFVSAFLLFLVQPMVGKRILPWFGGAPAVWSLCLAFYQSALFLGYAYAHLSIRFLAPRWQQIVHAAVLAAAFASLPVLPAAPDTAPDDAHPTVAVLRLLTLDVALPFLALAATGPLVQAFFARAHPARSPYPLYAVSNLGSLLALFAYPLVLEPRLPLSQTGTLWGVGFVATGLAVLACARPSGRGSTEVEAAHEPKPATAGIENGFLQAALWSMLAGTAVVLLMGVTNKLCLDVASVPFLWIVPLGLYLVTFILCFSSERAYSRTFFMGVALATLVATHLLAPGAPVLLEAFAYGALLFACCMVLHGELYRSRPEAGDLTRFYLCISAGGAVAGLLVGIAAPILFDDYHELPLGLLIGGLLLVLVCARDPRSFLFAGRSRRRLVVAAPLCLALIGYITWSDTRPAPGQVHKQRSFFGVLTVSDNPDIPGHKRSLRNGTTVHGTQFQDPSVRRFPTSYYGPATGIGLVMASRPPQGESNIGIIGLGVGTLAAYGRPGDLLRFYEIDPVVLEIAGAGGWFSFLSDSLARIEVVLGDARLALAREHALGGPQGFDLLVLDAFSSDAIPIHLLTREAFELYLASLAPDGYLAVHVSNRNFRLVNVLFRISAELGAHGLHLRTQTVPAMQSVRADWVLIARDRDRKERLAARLDSWSRKLDVPTGSVSIRPARNADVSGIPVWTDEYSDLLRALGREPEDDLDARSE